MPIRDNLLMGDGIYFAEDPFSSEHYGQQLVMLKTAPKAQGIYYDSLFHKLKNPNDRIGGIKSIVTKKDKEYVPAIFYNFAGMFNNIAVVVRYSDFIDKSDGIIINKPAKITAGNGNIPNKSVLEKKTIPELIVTLLPFVKTYPQLFTYNLLIHFLYKMNAFFVFYL